MNYNDSNENITKSSDEFRLSLDSSNCLQMPVNITKKDA